MSANTGITTKVVSARLSIPNVNKLDRLAAANKTHKGSFVRSLLERYLDSISDAVISDRAA